MKEFGTGHKIVIIQIGGDVDHDLMGQVVPSVSHKFSQCTPEEFVRFFRIDTGDTEFPVGGSTFFDDLLSAILSGPEAF